MKKFTCIICPKGCQITLNQTEIIGANCQKGEQYVKSQSAQKRILTTTVRTVYTDFPMLPVKTTKPVDFNEIDEIMNKIDSILIKEPLKLGGIVYKDICEGIDLVSTSDMFRRKFCGR